MSVTKPTPLRPTAAPRRTSRVRIAAVWFALLICSFLFGMLILSPLLGVVMSGKEKEKAPPPRPAQTRPNPRSSSVIAPREQPGLRVEDNGRRRTQPGPGISLTLDQSESTVQAADPIEPQPRLELGSAQPLVGSPITPPVSSGAPPSEGLSVEENPPPAPQPPGGIQRSERID